MYLDVERLKSIDSATFRAQSPYPWINPAGMLTEAGYQQLLVTMPPVELFTSHFGGTRVHGQQNHDRFSLPYRDDLAIAEPWKEFVNELRGPHYQTFLRRLIGTGSFELSFVWHYTPHGCSVSPHCDSKRKLGSHIFYFNTAQDEAQNIWRQPLDGSKPLPVTNFNTEQIFRFAWSPNGGNLACIRHTTTYDALILRTD